MPYKKVYNVSYYHEDDENLCWIEDIIALDETEAKRIAKNLIDPNKISIVEVKRI